MLNQQNFKLNIIHMNDLHSRFDNMMRISSFVKEAKSKAINMNEDFIVVDLGDHMDRMHMETEGTNGKVNVEVLNHTDVSVATIGNNEGLTFTKKELSEAYANKSFKIVACNIKDKDTGSLPEWLDAYWIQEINGIKIGWIGATAAYETFYYLQGWNVVEPIPVIKRIVSQIKSEVDIIILLSHLGIREDKRIATEIPEIDVILGAHTHRLLDNGIKALNQPLVCQVGIFGDYVGHLKIEYNSQNRMIELLKEETLSMKKFNFDPEVRGVIESYKSVAKEKLSKVISVLEQPLPISLDHESPLGNLLADGVRQWTNADIGFINAGQILKGLEAGEVTKGIIHEICPSPINSCKVILTGEQIKEILEKSLLNEYKYRSFQGYGFRGKILGSLTISGLTIDYNPDNPPYKKIVRINYNGGSMEKEEKYTVGTLDMFTFGGGYSLREAEQVEYFLPEFIRDILEYQLANKEAIKNSFSVRWRNID